MVGNILRLRSSLLSLVTLPLWTSQVKTLSYHCKPLKLNWIYYHVLFIKLCGMVTSLCSLSQIVLLNFQDIDIVSSLSCFGALWQSYYWPQAFILIDYGELIPVSTSNWEMLEMRNWQELNKTYQTMLEGRN